MMPGTRASSISVAASVMQKIGLIEYSRGRMKIRDRVGLTGGACECYQVVKDEYLRLGLAASLTG